MTNRPPESDRDQVAEARAKQAAEDYEFERPWRDMVGRDPLGESAAG